MNESVLKNWMEKTNTVPFYMSGNESLVLMTTPDNKQRLLILWSVHMNCCFVKTKRKIVKLCKKYQSVVYK